MKYSILFLFILISHALQALEIDEKLTIRFLKVSNSKKTILINRGSEDGLSIGDHAKFFITSGVIARGVVEKVSPSRSIWSFYRLVDPSEVVDGKVLNLKISSPVKITEDVSKSLKEDEIPTENTPEKAKESEAEAKPGVDEADKKELEGMGLDYEQRVNKAETISKKLKSSKKQSLEGDTIFEDIAYRNEGSTKLWETWGLLSYNSLSGTIVSSVASNSVSNSSLDLTIGLEHYFFKSDDFLKLLSLNGFLHKKTESSSSTDSTGSVSTSKTDLLEYGVGLNFHFYNPANSIAKLIGYGSFTLGIGSPTSEAAGITTKGSSTFFSLGIGMKYILTNNFGLRGLLDYYRISESFDFADGETQKYTLSGPRVGFGFSYRF